MPRVLTPAEAAEMAAKSAETRRHGVFLSREEAAALRDAYALLRSIARRGKLRQLVADDPTNDDGPSEDGPGSGV